MEPLERITHRVVKISLPLPIPAPKQVNCYAIVAESGDVTLIDPGWATDETEKSLQAALQLLGVGPSNVKQILVTHAHWDHFSQGIDWQRRYGIPVLVGAGERPTIEAFHEAQGLFPLQVAQLRRAGAPELAQAIANSEPASFERGVPHGPPDRYLDGGEIFDLGGQTIEVIATPGHTRGHLVFHHREDNLLFTGDHVLPRITPSVAFERVPEPLGLRSYLTSLRTLLQRPDALMMPAHGAVGSSVHERVSELLDHHAERLAEVTDHVAAGSSTAVEVARAMRWTRQGKTVDELGSLHGMTAVIETNVHLELLTYQGVLRRAENDGVETFSIAS